MKVGVPVAILVLALVAVAVMLVNVATGAQPGYADLIPAPDAVVWRVGDDRALWLSSNRHAVTMRIASKDLGVGAFNIERANGEVDVLGEGLGCLDAVVSGVDITNITDTSATVEVDLDRETDSTTKTVYWRRYESDSEPPVAGNSITTTTATAAIVLSALVAGDVHRVDVSMDDRFPVAVTRTVTFTSGSTLAAPFDHRGREVALPQGIGVALLACAETDDAIITLHGRDGTELNRYRVDVMASSTAWTMRPTGEATSRAVTATSSDGDTLSYALGVEDPNEHYFFFGVSSSGQITVDGGGANDTSGLDDDRVYPIVLTAIDGNGGRGRITVAVQLDATNESPGDNGLC